MKIVRMLFPFLAIAAIAGCSSIDNAKVDLIPPEIGLRQLGGPGIAGSQVTGPLSVNLRLTVFNPSLETITLKRVDFSTIGQGAYTVSGASRPFGKTIGPDQTIEVETWLPATAESTIVGANGPVTMRVTAFFGSEVGQFRKVYTINMNTEISPLPKPD
ncbi:MAG: hypothetical protein HYU52_03690 [Acidobacteria bacterium]|nr:hypothetical protein [Acidobacteriota bacterium]